MNEAEATAKTEKQVPQAVATRPESLWQPFSALRNEVDRLFDGFWRGMAAGGVARPASSTPQSSWQLGGSFDLPIPAIDLVEAEEAFCIKAELPGMDAKDVELTLSEDMLTIKGEKKAEHEEKEDNYHASERRFRTFSRSFPLPRGVDRDRIDANFEKGVLTVRLPKTAEAAAQQRKIDVNQKP